MFVRPTMAFPGMGPQSSPNNIQIILILNYYTCSQPLTYVQVWLLELLQDSYNNHSTALLMLLVNLPRIKIDPGFIQQQILVATWLDREHFPHLKLWQLKRVNQNFPYHPLWTHVKIWSLELLHLLHLHQIRAQYYPATTQSSKQSQNTSDSGFHTVPCSHHHIVLCWILSNPANRAATLLPVPHQSCSWLFLHSQIQA